MERPYRLFIFAELPLDNRFVLRTPWRGGYHACARLDGRLECRFLVDGLVVVDQCLGDIAQKVAALLEGLQNTLSAFVVGDDNRRVAVSPDRLLPSAPCGCAMP